AAECKSNENATRGCVRLSHRIALRNHYRSRERGTFDPGIQSHCRGPSLAILVAMELATFIDLYLHTISSCAHFEGASNGHDRGEATRRLGRGIHPAGSWSPRLDIWRSVAAVA